MITSRERQEQHEEAQGDAPARHCVVSFCTTITSHLSPAPGLLLWTRPVGVRCHLSGNPLQVNKSAHAWHQGGLSPRPAPHTRGAPPTNGSRTQFGPDTSRNARAAPQCTCLGREPVPATQMPSGGGVWRAAVWRPSRFFLPFATQILRVATPPRIPLPLRKPISNHARVPFHPPW